MAKAAPARLPPAWLVQERALVRFKDDPTLLHCRIVLDCKEGNLCKVATPDRDINETKLESGPVFTEVLRMVGDGFPGTSERETLIFRNTQSKVSSLRESFWNFAIRQKHLDMNKGSLTESLGSSLKEKSGRL